MSKVSREIATAEIEKWLSHKKVKEKKRESFKDAIETLTDAISEGSLVVNEDNTLTVKLDFPLGAEGQIKDLTFKARVDIATIQAQMVGIKASDGDGRILATIAALTGQSKSILGKMDSGEDYSLVSSIAIFFL